MNETLHQINPLETPQRLEHLRLKRNSLLQRVLLLLSEGTHHLQNSKQLIALIRTHKERLQQSQFSHYASHRPHIHSSRVLSNGHNQFRSTIVPRHHVRSILTIRVDNLTTPEITNLYLAFAVQQNVLRLQITMSNLSLVHLLYPPQHLIHITLSHTDCTFIVRSSKKVPFF